MNKVAYIKQIEKMAKLTQEETEELNRLSQEQQKASVDVMKKNLPNMLKSQIGAGAVLGGLTIANKQRKEGYLDGIVRRYHNTGNENVDSIKQNGILSNKALDVDNLTSKATNLSDTEKAGKTYLAKSREGARSAGAKRNQVRRANLFYAPSETDSLIDSFKTDKTLKVNIPLQDYKKMNKVSNPELKGAKNAKQFNAAQKERLGALNDPLKNRAVYKKLGKGTDTIQGDIASKYIKGGKGYTKQSLKGVLEHIKANPKMFAKGVAGTGLGLALAGTGGYSAVKSLNENIKRNSEFKKQLKENPDTQRIKDLSRKFWEKDAYEIVDSVYNKI